MLKIKFITITDLFMRKYLLFLFLLIISNLIVIPQTTERVEIDSLKKQIPDGKIVQE